MTFAMPPGRNRLDLTVAKWTAVAKLLAPKDVSIVKSVRLAIERPDEYVKTHARDLADRGVTKPIPELPSLALLDALDAARLVALIDWKSATEDVVFLLRKLKTNKNLSWAWMKPYDEDDLDDLSLDRLLKAIASEADRNFALVNIDTSSDQYAIAIVERARASQIVKAMNAVGERAEVIVGKPLAKPKPKPTRVRAGTPMAKWPSCVSDASNTSRYFFHRENRRSLWTRRWEGAFEVMEGPAWSWSMKHDRRDFRTTKACTKGYVDFIEQLRRDGWLQFTLPEANKEMCAQIAAHRKK